MAKFKAGQGAGRGDANGGCAGAAEQGGRGGCVLLPCAALSTQKPPNREATMGKSSEGCCVGTPVVLGGIWVAGGLMVLGAVVLLWGISVSWRRTDATVSRLVLWRCFRGNWCC